MMTHFCVFHMSLYTAFINVESIAKCKKEKKSKNILAVHVHAEQQTCTSTDHIRYIYSGAH